MLIETNDFVKVSTYAHQNNVSVTWVYKLIKLNVLEMILIDGVKFVRIDNLG
jgi:hypothetical protein